MLEIKEVENKNTWEKYIADYSPQSLFQSWNWGEVIKKSQISNLKSQILWRLGLYKEDILLGIAQVVKVMARRGTFLHVRHGPIITEWKKAYFDVLFDYVKDMGGREKAVFIRISPQLPDSDDNKRFFKDYKFIEAPIPRLDGEVCWVLDLDRSEEELLSGMRKTTRYLIRQAEKLGVKIVKSKKTDDLDDFLKIYIETARRHHFVKHTGIKEEYEELLKENNILLFKGYNNDILLSAALIIFYNNQAIYHHSASLQQKIPVNYLLQWEVIKEAKKRGCKIYNLWGIAPNKSSRHPWRGLTLFKQGFGGRQVEFLHALDYPFSMKYCATYTIEWCRKIWRGY